MGNPDSPGSDDDAPGAEPMSMEEGEGDLAGFGDGSLDAGGLPAEDAGAPEPANPRIAQEALSLEGCRFSQEGSEVTSDRPSFEERQGYLRPASEFGIDAEYAWTVPGGTGKNVTVADIEYATWNLDHEDLKGTRICFAQNGSGAPFDFSDDHGTGVIGVMTADANGFGVTGIVHEAALLVVNHANDDQGFASAIASALAEATARLQPGDVVLIEANTDGQRGLVEHDRDVFDAIARAVDAGLIVLETAGNGGANLDDVELFGDSGAIILGGGASANSRVPLAPMGLNYGSRVDLQGWGRDVATLSAAVG